MNNSTSTTIANNKFSGSGNIWKVYFSEFKTEKSLFRKFLELLVK